METSDTNPYDGFGEPELHAAWKEGYRAGNKGRPYPNENPYEKEDEDERAEAWLSGYTAARRMK